jgi:hypothetical protein
MDSKVYSFFAEPREGLVGQVSVFLIRFRGKRFGSRERQQTVG